MPKTTHIPTGKYPEPSPTHALDLEGIADRLTAELPGSRRKTESLARESGVSLIMMAMEGGDEIKEHGAEGVVTVQVLRGHAILSTDGQPFDLRPGQLMLFQPAVRHNVRAEEQSVLLLTVTGGAE